MEMELSKSMCTNLIKTYGRTYNAEQRIVIYNLHMIICGLHEADTIPVLIKMCQYPYL